MTSNASAVRIHRHGGPEELRLEAVDLAPPGPGQAQVRQSAVGVNFIDVYHRSGLYKLPALPATLGTEGAGVIEALGPGAPSDLAVGQRVAYATTVPGAYATRCNVAADRLVPLPDAIAERTAAASLLKGLTAEYLIRRCFRVEAGMTVLFHAAAGGTGLLATQWLAALGATVIGTVSSDEKAALARAHGTTHPIVYTREDFVARTRELTQGRGVQVVYDSVGKDTFLGSLDCLAPRGTLVSFGNASGAPEPFNPLLLSQKGSLYLTRPTLATYTAQRADLLAAASALFEALTSKQVAVRIEREWPLADAAGAHRALESRATTGSSILIP